MGVGHRAVLLWILALVSLIIIAMYADGGLDQQALSLFAVLSSVDVCLFAIGIIRLIRHYRSMNIRQSTSGAISGDDVNFNAKQMYLALTLIALKILFEMMICLKINRRHLSLIWIMLPAWTALVLIIGDLSRRLFRIHHKTVPA